MAARNAASILISVADASSPSSEVVGRISEQLETSRVGRLFAVVHVAGKQRKVTAEDIIVLDKFIDADIGQRIRLNKVRYLASLPAAGHRPAKSTGLPSRLLVLKKLHFLYLIFFPDFDLFFVWIRCLMIGLAVACN